MSTWDTYGEDFLENWTTPTKGGAAMTGIVCTALVVLSNGKMVEGAWDHHMYGRDRVCRRCGTKRPQERWRLVGAERFDDETLYVYQKAGSGAAATSLSSREFSRRTS